MGIHSAKSLGRFLQWLSVLTVKKNILFGHETFTSATCTCCALSSPCGFLWGLSCCPDFLESTLSTGILPWGPLDPSSGLNSCDPQAIVWCEYVCIFMYFNIFIIFIFFYKLLFINLNFNVEGLAVALVNMFPRAQGRGGLLPSVWLESWLGSFLLCAYMWLLSLVLNWYVLDIFHLWWESFSYCDSCDSVKSLPFSPAHMTTDICLLNTVLSLISC